MRDATKEIEILSKNTVRMKNRDRVNEIITNMAKGGCARLQVVSDFDKTITKQHDNGDGTLSSFGIFSRIRSIADNTEFQNAVETLREKYYPIEIDPNMSVEEKVKFMEEWWMLSEKAISGLEVTKQDIEDVCSTCPVTLRDGCSDLFTQLSQHNIPVLVFSAGHGDIVLEALKQSGLYTPNVKVVSNFLKFHENGTVLGFQDKIIHVFNKNEYALKDSDFYGIVADKGNAIVMGDSLGDANMTDGMEHCQNVLKIGFLYDHVEDALSTYLDTFDVVLVDDQSMDVPCGIFDFIRNFSG